MTTAKGVAKVCVRKRMKPYLVPVEEATALRKAAKAENFMRLKLERIQELLGVFEEEILSRDMMVVRVQDGRPKGPSNGQLEAESNISILEDEIQELIEKLKKQIPAFWYLKIISIEQRNQFKNQLEQLEDRYFNCMLEEF